ncbi:MAG: mercuric transporter MerT family protein [Gemmatimonadales bacterium]
MTPITKSVLAATGGIAAAAGSAACCIGPLAALALGVSGAGIAATFEPLRPYLLAGAFGLVGLGFVALRREERKACEPGTTCSSPMVRRRMRRALWTATGLVALFATFPWWIGLIL